MRRPALVTTLFATPALLQEQPGGSGFAFTSFNATIGVEDEAPALGCTLSIELNDVTEGYRITVGQIDVSGKSGLDTGVQATVSTSTSWTGEEGSKMSEDQVLLGSAVGIEFPLDFKRAAPSPDKRANAETRPSSSTSTSMFPWSATPTPRKLRASSQSRLRGAPAEEEDPVEEDECVVDGEEEAPPAEEEPVEEAPEDECVVEEDPVEEVPEDECATEEEGEAAEEPAEPAEPEAPVEEEEPVEEEPVEEEPVEEEPVEEEPVEEEPVEEEPVEEAPVEGEHAHGPYWDPGEDMHIDSQLKQSSTSHIQYMEGHFNVHIRHAAS
ncbi:unnamed protein product [Parascedosporium putredinis]|uniref:Uncharacterized protein n=1 Tax=Parascedosporium putredinis TaxID=1442378 RepID=A0A9P1M9B9_9PEZI|nr:unnamed protein product [Parascedosporium putredinis]CAI7991650.1 unnamed protein product [Parascedosporium putredinis]